MNSLSSNQYELHYFSRDTCKYCRYAKPIYENEIRPTFRMNGIPCYEYDTSKESIAKKKSDFNVKTVPTLILLEVSPTTGTRELFRGDSTTIRNSLKVLEDLYHKLDDSF